jgi:DNA modification methylase
MKKESKNCNTVERNESLQFKKEIPNDLHWKEELEGKMWEGFKYLGEIFNVDQNKYYSALGGKKYLPKHEEKHLDAGHYEGYRFAIEHLTNQGDWVFDPTVGTGTAITEAINQGRNGIGIELEWPDLCKKNVEYQESSNKGIVIDGNALYLLELLKPYEDEFKEFSLIVNGTPYPVISGGKSSDAPERGPGEIDNYQNNDSFGLLKWNKDYSFFIRKMYKDAIKHLKSGGYFVTIIKDPTNKRSPFMLQKAIMEWVMEDNKEMEEYGFFVHRHVPETMFMRTYPKRFPEVNLPKYQIAYILKKK